MQEVERGEFDVMSTDMRSGQLVVNEPRVKVDLAKFTERHVFKFDAVLDESVDSNAVYRCTFRSSLLQHVHADRVESVDVIPHVESVDHNPVQARRCKLGRKAIDLDVVLQANSATATPTLPGGGQGNLFRIWSDRKRQNAHHAGIHSYMIHYRCTALL